jgi:hypothetical protein
MLQVALQVSQALLPFVIAALGAWIAWQQMLNARRKLRLDLFDKRFEVYQFFNEFAYYLLAFSDSDKMNRFWAQFQDMHGTAELLFGGRISSLVAQLDSAANEFSSQKRDDAVARRRLVAAHDQLRDAMLKFLQFEDVR